MLLLPQKLSRITFTPPTTLERLRVLVADGYADGANTLTTLLNFWGHDVRVARDGLEALGAALTYRPDVALVEVILPGLDGYQLAHRLRRQGTIVVAVSGQAGEKHRRRCQEAGIALALVKPVSPERLRDFLAVLAEETGRGCGLSRPGLLAVPGVQGSTRGPDLFG